MARRWFSKRALLWHLLVAIIVPGCLYAGWWQAHRAIGGNTLSWAYTFEWPIFAVVAIVGWWQLVTEDPAEVEARRHERIRRAQPLRLPSATPQLLAANRAALERRRVELGATTSAPGALVGSGDADAGRRAGGGMSAYNLYLATLATEGRTKTWRNPSGMPRRFEDDR